MYRRQSNDSTSLPDVPSLEWPHPDGGLPASIIELDVALHSSGPISSPPSISSISNRWQTISEVVPSNGKGLCRVCGGPSTGHHYDIRSCNGCRSFFRRTLLERRRFVCERDGNCAMLPKLRATQKRRQCRACRFKLCIEAGMNPSGFVVDTEEAREAIQSALKRLCSKKLVSAGDIANRLIDNLMHFEGLHEAFRRSDCNPSPSNPQSITDVLQRFALLGQPIQDMQGWPLKQTQARAVMSLEEHAQLRIPLPRLNTDNLPSSFKFWFYVDLVGAIEWAKTLEFFRSLEIPDQRALIVFSGWQLSNVTASYYSYISGSDQTLFPDGKFSTWSPRESGRDLVRIMLHLRIDRTEYLLLKLLIICNPSKSCERISINARKILQLERKTLSKLLFCHCMNVYKRPSRYFEIISMEATLLYQAQKAKQLQALLTTLNLRQMRIVLLDEICEIEHLT